MNAADRKVYATVKERAIRTDIDGYEYLGCEQCGHNGSKYPLQMCHKILRSQGGKVSMENIYLGCLKCHNEDDHGANIVDSQPNYMV